MFAVFRFDETGHGGFSGDASVSVSGRYHYVDISWAMCVSNEEFSVRDFESPNLKISLFFVVYDREPSNRSLSDSVVGFGYS